MRMAERVNVELQNGIMAKGGSACSDMAAVSITTLFGSSQESTGRQAFWCPKKQGGGIRLLTDIRPILLTLSYRFKGNSRLPNQVS